MPSELDKAAATIRDNTANELKSMINSVHASATAIEVARLPEDVFKESFLPYFAGEMELDKQSPIVMQWVEYAGGPYNEVSIIDKEGKVLYNTPPIFSQSNVINEDAMGVPFHTMAETYQRKNDRFAIEGTKYAKAVTANIPDKIDVEELDNDKSRWKNIFNKNTTPSNDGAKDISPTNDSTLSGAIDYD